MGLDLFLFWIQVKSGPYTLQGRNHSLAQFGHIVKDVKYIASCLQHYMFSHVPRHCNKVAHALARRAISYPYILVWMEDVSSDMYFRLI